MKEWIDYHWTGDAIILTETLIQIQIDLFNIIVQD